MPTRRAVAAPGKRQNNEQVRTASSPAHESASRQKRAGFPRSLSAHARSAAIRCATAQRPPRAVPRAGQWRQAVHAGLPAGPRAVPRATPRALPRAVPRAVPRARLAVATPPRLALASRRASRPASRRASRSPLLVRVHPLGPQSPLAPCAGMCGLCRRGAAEYFSEQPLATAQQPPSSRRAAAELAADGARTCGAPLSAARAHVPDGPSVARAAARRAAAYLGQRRASGCGACACVCVVSVRLCNRCLCAHVLEIL